MPCFYLEIRVRPSSLYTKLFTNQVISKAPPPPHTTPFLHPTRFSNPTDFLVTGDNDDENVALQACSKGKLNVKKCFPEADTDVKG